MSEPISRKAPGEVDHAKLYAVLVGELTDFVIVLIDRSGCLSSWNPAVERHFGYTQQEFIGMEACRLFTPEDIEAGVPEQEIKTATRFGRAPDIRWHVRKDGSRLFVEGVLVALRDEDNRLLGFSKVMRDITERKINEDRLRMNEERFRLAEEGAQVGTWDWDVRAGQVTRSAEHCRLFGEEPRERTQTFEQWLSLVHPDDRVQVEANLKDALSTGRIDCDFRIVRADGKTRWMQTIGRVYYESGEPVRMVRVVQDVTVRKEAEAELRRSNEDLQQFANVVSHELQMPIRMVKSYAELLARRYKGKLDSTADEFIRTITDGAEAMEQLTRSVLQLAQAGEGAGERTSIRVDAVVNGALANLSPEIEATGATVTCGELPTVVADRMQLLQLFHNLIGNALKYRHPQRPPQIRITAERRSAEVTFKVADNGIGIDSRYWERVFSPLKRLHGAEIPGTGIGLALCRKIVERHGGRIWVESRPGEGSIFFFTLPG